MSGRPGIRLLLALIRLYPRWWRDSYGAEFADLVVMLVTRRRRDVLSLAADIVIGALDAHVAGGVRPAATRDPAVRQGLFDGFRVAGALAAGIAVLGFVFPMGPNESDDDPPYRQEVLAGYAMIAVLLVVIGLRARRRSDTAVAGAKAGAMAGLVISVALVVTFLLLDNMFFGTVSQRHDQLVAFTASHWSSQRAFVNVTLLVGAAALVPFLTAAGASLGFVGGQLARVRRARA